MKIALCISGYPRSIKESYKSHFKHLLSKHKIDTFIHVWDSDEIEQIKNLYTPLLINVEPQIIFPKLKYSQRSLPRFLDPKLDNVYSMFYSVKQANLLKQTYENLHNFKYDIVIRSRFDLIFNSKLDILNQNLNNIFTLGQCPYGDQGCNDNFALSNSLNMDIYSNVFDNIDYIMNNTNCLYSPEHILKAYLDLHNIKILDGNINHELYRI